jgi:cysteine synthase
MESIARQNVVESVGNTPLIELSSFSTKDIKFYAKLEWYNPFGSVKDRAAYWMVKDAEKKGLLKKGKSIIIEPTSGNTGIALAGIATSLGYQVEIVIPEKVSGETKKILKDLGALLHETSDDLFPELELERIKALHWQRPLQNQDQTYTICLINMRMMPTTWLTMTVPDQRFGRRRTAKSPTFSPVAEQAVLLLASPRT